MDKFIDRYQKRPTTTPSAKLAAAAVPEATVRRLLEEAKRAHQDELDQYNKLLKTKLVLDLESKIVRQVNEAIVQETLEHARTVFERDMKPELSRAMELEVDRTKRILITNVEEEVRQVKRDLETEVSQAKRDKLAMVDTEVSQAKRDKLALIEMEVRQAKRDQLALIEMEVSQAKRDKLALIETEVSQAKRDKLAVVDTEVSQAKRDKLALIETEKKSAVTAVHRVQPHAALEHTPVGKPSIPISNDMVARLLKKQEHQHHPTVSKINT